MNQFIVLFKRKEKWHITIERCDFGTFHGIYMWWIDTFRFPYQWRGIPFILIDLIQFFHVNSENKEKTKQTLSIIKLETQSQRNRLILPAIIIIHIFIWIWSNRMIQMNRLPVLMPCHSGLIRTLMLFLFTNLVILGFHFTLPIHTDFTIVFRCHVRNVCAPPLPACTFSSDTRTIRPTTPSPINYHHKCTDALWCILPILQIIGN